MITAFWHGFGLSNGLDIKKEDIEEIRYARGTPRIVYRVKKEVMQEKLVEYLRWLEQYQQSWGTERHTCPPYERADILEPHQPERLSITQMIELLQI